MDNKVLRIVYTFFVGVMLALFVGLGIDTFYPGPDEPQYPFEVADQPTPEEQRDYDDELQAYQDAQEGYNRTVAVIATVSAVLMMGLSLLLEKTNTVLTNGVMLGGLFTLLYGVGRGFASGDTTTTFITVAVGLAVVVFLGYRRFGQRGDDAGPPPPDAPAPPPGACLTPDYRPRP